MPDYVVNGASAGADAAETAVGITQGATLRRPLLYEFGIGCAAAPTDAQFTIAFGHTTAAGSGGTTPTPGPVDGDNTIASAVTARIGHTGEPTYAGIPFAVPIHHRNTYRWIARIGKEFGMKVAAAAGFGLKRTAASSGTPAMTGVLMWSE